MALSDMQDKTTKVFLGGQEFTAHQLFIRDWAQIERELKPEGITISDILSGEVSIVAYQSVVKAALGQDIPPKTELKELFQAAGSILTLDSLASESPNGETQAGR
jgi:hypothetical protein